MKKKFFIFSDVHGEFNALENSLIEAGYDRYNENHVLVSLGDNFDRGEQSRDVYYLLKRAKARSICIKGNHEVFLEEALTKGTDGEYVLFNFLHNGLDKTIESFSGTKMGAITNMDVIDNMIDMINIGYPELLSWLKSRPLYYETKNYIFVHAGIHPTLLNWKDTDEHFMLWDIDNSHIPCMNTGKTIIFGHHHAFRVKRNAENAGYRVTELKGNVYGCKDDNAPILVGNKIAIDPCSNFTHKVNVIVIEDETLDENTVKESKDMPIDNSVRIDVDPQFYTRATIRTTDNRPVTVAYNPFEPAPWPDYQGMWADTIITDHIGR